MGLKKRILPYVLVVCLALLTEIFIFNFRSYESLLYKEKMLGEFESHIENDVKEGRSSLYIDAKGETIKNIYLDMGMFDTNRKILEDGHVYIAIQEVGDSFFNVVAERVIGPETHAAKYIFWKTKGETNQVRVDFPLREGKSLRLYEVKLNAHRPLFFSILRFLILTSAGILCYNTCKALVVKKDYNHEPHKTGDETDDTCV